ncbi:MAG: HAMP domain-containing protein [Anaerolineales bacterium]
MRHPQSPAATESFRDLRGGENAAGRTAQRFSDAPGARHGGLTRNLLLLSLALALGPLLVVTLLVYQQARSNYSSLVNAQLNSLSITKESQLDQWANQQVAELTDLAAAPELQQAVESRLAGVDSPSLGAALERFAVNHPAFASVLLVRAEDGEVLAASNDGRDWRGRSLASETFFEPLRYEPMFVPPQYNPALLVDTVTLLASAPVISPNRGTGALLLGILHDEPLLKIIAPAPGLGVTGQAYAVTRDGYQLGRFITSISTRVDSEGVRRAVQQNADGNAEYLNPTGEWVVGRYNWLDQYQLALLVEQHSAEAFAPLQQTALILAGATLLAALFSLGVALLFTRRLTAPIRALTAGATRIAGGDLDARVEVQRDDELGVLAAAFNRMSDDLQITYRSLRSTSEARARQLAAAADISRAAVANQGLEPLLARVVDVIRERFGCERVAVILLEETGAAIVQEAAGSWMRPKGSRALLGSSTVVGQAIVSLAPRIVNDVAADSTLELEERLADVRTAAAFPLRVGERVTGALELQSERYNALSPADAETLQILADQIAVAVENDRLLSRQKRVLQLEDLTLALTNKIHQSLKPETILESAALELGRALGAQRAVVKLFGDDAPLRGARERNSSSEAQVSLAPAPRDGSDNGR